MERSRWKIVIALSALLLLVGVHANAAGKKAKVDMPTLTCAGSTQTAA
jgi:hypothetical protein